MNTTVSLNYGQVLTFVELKDAYVEKNGAKVIKEKLEEMGCSLIPTEGSRKKAVYTIDIPEGHWVMSMTNTKHSEVAVDCMKAIIGGNVGEDGLAQFDADLIERIALKHDKPKNTVKNSFEAIKRYLLEHNLIGYCKKSHRVKKTEGGPWLTGDLGMLMHERAKNIWGKFYDRIHELIKEVQPDISKKALDVLSKPYGKAKLYKMTKELNVFAYTTVKEIQVNPKLAQDIDYARTRFLETLDMAIVREEIRAKHLDYKQEKTDSEATEPVESGLTKEQRKKIHSYLERTARDNLIA
jgi:hypothetical protein